MPDDADELERGVQLLGVVHVAAAGLADDLPEEINLVVRDHKIGLPIAGTGQGRYFLHGPDFPPVKGPELRCSLHRPGPPNPPIRFT